MEFDKGVVDACYPCHVREAVQRPARHKAGWRQAALAGNPHEGAVVRTGTQQQVPPAASPVPPTPASLSGVHLRAVHTLILHGILHGIST